MMEKWDNTISSRIFLQKLRLFQMEKIRKPSPSVLSIVKIRYVQAGTKKKLNYFEKEAFEPNAKIDKDEKEVKKNNFQSYTP